MEVMICAHRGLTRSAPENSMPAVTAAWEAGFKAVEIDVRHTADGVLVLMHDGTLDRTSTGRGPLEGLSYDELQRLRLRWQGRPFSPVPTLAEVMRACDGGSLLYIDMKTDRLELIVQAVQKHRAHDWTILHGGAEALARIQASDPRIRLHTIVDTREELDRLLGKVSPVMVEASRPPASGYLDYVHSRGLLLELDTMGTPDRAGEEKGRYDLWREYLSCGADFIMSDYPDSLRSFMLTRLEIGCRERLF